MKHIRSLLIVLLLVASPTLCDAQINSAIKNEYVRVGNVDSEYATREQILSDPQLISLNRDCKVIDFTVDWFPNAAEHVSYEMVSCKASGSKFTSDQIALIKRDKRPGAFCIREIKLQCQQNLVDAPSIMLRIR